MLKPFRFPSLPDDPLRELWPFYLDHAQQTWVRKLREAWGEDCVIQIANNRVRIISDEGQAAFVLADRASPSRQSIAADDPAWWRPSTNGR